MKAATVVCLILSSMSCLLAYSVVNSDRGGMDDMYSVDADDTEIKNEATNVDEYNDR